MHLADYIAKVRRQAAALDKQIASITEKGSRMWSRCGAEPVVETSGRWLKELNRRRSELLAITSALEQRRPLR
jgi:hypothetical protein